MSRRYPRIANPVRRIRRIGRTPEMLEPRQVLAGDVQLVADSFTVRQNSDPGPLDVLANDLFGGDYPGARQITAVSYGSEGGQIAVSANGRSLEYRPPADFAGEEQFRYFVDGEFFASVNVQVISPLDADQFRLHPDGLVHTLDVLANDPFWAGYAGPKQITLVSASDSGNTVEVAADGKSVLYRSDELTSGEDQFFYIVDGKYSASVKVEIPPALDDDSYEILQNAEPQPLQVLANDPFWAGYDGARRITHLIASSPASGAAIEIAPSGAAVHYTPAPGFSGYDTFTYVVDGRFETNASVYVIRPVENDAFEVDVNSSGYAIDVISNDRYWSPQRMTYVDVVNRVTSVGTSDQGGSVAVGANGLTVVYSPPAGFVGNDKFTYIADGRYEATVTVAVTRPVRDDYLTVYQDTPDQLLRVLDNDFLGNGYQGARQLTHVETSEQGVAPAIAGNTIRYTPPSNFVGSDKLIYTVDDLLKARVQLSVVPLAQSDYYHFCATGSQSYSLPVLGNDYFERGYTGPGVITAASLASGNGSVSVATDGRSLVYRPSTSMSDQITYTVDGKYQASVSIWRQSYLSPDLFVTDQNSAARSFDVLANDFNNNTYGDCAASYSGPRNITGVRASDSGATVKVSADGRRVEYQPPADFVGQDSFTYIVDGTMEVTATVSVVRRVRDDEFRVEPGTTESLPVLVNDLFGADYRGAQRITSVTSSTAGAIVTIADDGRSLSYQASAAFRGVDTLTYTVDGRLKAQVEVNVRPDGESAFPQFAALAEFEQFLIDDALKRYEYQFGRPSYWYGDIEDGAGPAPSAGNGSVRDHSETNVQVAGIDEGDIVEFDADYLYMLAGDDVVILDAWPAESLAEVARVEIDGSALVMYLHGDRLTVISQVAMWPDPVVFDGPVAGGIAVDGVPFRPDWLASYETIVTVLDVSNRHEPTTVQQTRMEGRYVQSRGIGDYVYLTLSNQAVPPGPQVIPAEPGPNGEAEPGLFETKEQYVARVRANLGQFVADTLPNYSSFGPDGTLARSGLLHEPEDIYRPLTQGASTLVSLVSIHVEQHEPGLASSSAVYTNGATEIYASLEHLYVFENGYDVEDGSVTRILLFDWDAETGGTQFVAAGQVPGYMLNQFSADEYEGHLRVVTTVSHSYSSNWTGVAENDLFVLRPDNGVLEFVGAMQNVGLGETARSVRFMGPRAFLVTFQTVDPLFALDVSDPAEPRVVGHLTLPGFASYAQLIDDTHLLTVGRNTPTGISGPAQVSLYDVSDLQHPRLIDEHTFARFSESEAAADHHAFGYFARHGLLAVPTIRSYVERTDEDGDGFAETRAWTTENDLMVFRVDTTAAAGTNLGLQLVGEIQHDSAVRRSGYIDDKLFSIADDSVHVVNVSTPQTIIGSAQDLRREKPVEPPEEWDIAAVIDSHFSAAQQDLAGRLSVARDLVMPVVTEQQGAVWQTIVRVGSTYYRYRADGTTVELTDDDFQFADSAAPAPWQNPRNVLDVNADGFVAPSDAILLINRLEEQGIHVLPLDMVARQIDVPLESDQLYWDTSGDGILSPLDVLLVINELNRMTRVDVSTGSLSVGDPVSLTDIAAVDEFFARVRRTAGDSDLDGRFASSDLVQIFQRGKYENGIAGSATWQDGDWNGDRVFDSSDLVFAFIYGKYGA